MSLLPTLLLIVVSVPFKCYILHIKKRLFSDLQSETAFVLDLERKLLLSIV